MHEKRILPRRKIRKNLPNKRERIKIALPHPIQSNVICIHTNSSIYFKIKFLLYRKKSKHFGKSSLHSCAAFTLTHKRSVKKNCVCIRGEKIATKQSNAYIKQSMKYKAEKRKKNI